MSKLFLILLSLLGLTTAGLVFIYPVLALNVNKEDNPTSQAERTITVNDNGWHLVIHTKETDLARILLANNIRLNQLDKIYPDFNQPVFDAIIIERAVEVVIKADGQEKQLFTHQKTVSDSLLKEAGINLDQWDRVEPNLDSQLFYNLEIKVTRVAKETKTIRKNIDFETIYEAAPDMLLGKTKILSSGQTGEKEEEYLIIYEDNKEVNRILQKTTILKEPVAKTVVRGTKLLIGRKETGIASFVAKSIYSGLTAAHNSRSVIVKIIDRGPYVAGRVIDLSYEAFSSISNSDGLARVKIEEILN